MGKGGGGRDRRGQECCDADDLALLTSCGVSLSMGDCKGSQHRIPSGFCTTCVTVRETAKFIMGI